MCADQGHHRARAGGQSVRLYSRDDAFGALSLHDIGIEACAGGFRPMRPQGRGAQAPAEEPDVVLPPLSTNKALGIDFVDVPMETRAWAGQLKALAGAPAVPPPPALPPLTRKTKTGRKTRMTS